MIQPNEIDRMSTAERLRTMEQLWDALRREEGHLPSPEWHGQILANRKERAKRGEARFLTLDQLRAHVRGTDQ